MLVHVIVNVGIGLYIIHFNYKWSFEERGFGTFLSKFHSCNTCNGNKSIKKERLQNII